MGGVKFEADKFHKMIIVISFLRIRFNFLLETFEMVKNTRNGLVIYEMLTAK